LLPRWSEQGRDEEQEETYYAQHANRGGRFVCGVSASRRKRSLERRRDFVGWLSRHSFRRAPNGRISTYAPRLNLDRDDALGRVRQLLSESLVPALETQAPGVRYVQRSSSAGDLFWIRNAWDEAQKVNLLLRPTQLGTPFLWDAWNATSTRLPVWMPLSPDEGGGITLSLQMPANGTVFLWIEASNELAPHGERATFEVEHFRWHQWRAVTPQKAECLSSRCVRKAVWYGGVVQGCKFRFPYCFQTNGMKSQPTARSSTHRKWLCLMSGAIATCF
jgi:hypothetical protein